MWQILTTADKEVTQRMASLPDGAKSSAENCSLAIEEMLDIKSFCRQV